MNDSFEKEIRYRILKLLAAQPNLSQRALSKKTGISLGKTNYVLSELANKGIIKMKRLKNAPEKIPYAYILTPRGQEQKTKITFQFLKQKISEYEEIKRQINEITEELKTAHANENAVYAKIVKKAAGI